MSVAENSLAGTAKTSPGFLDSSVGKKVVMAVTGVMLFGFVTVHMLGNMQVYGHAESMNAYAEFLQTMIHGKGIWAFRLVMLCAAGSHAWAALSLTLANRAARPVGYRAQQLQAATFASRTMRWTGVILGIFIIFHILHLTTGTIDPTGTFKHGLAYQNVINGLSVGWVAAFYVIAQLCLGFHMWHGVWSLTQTLGWSHPRYNALRRKFAYVMAILVAGVNISFPVAIFFNLIHL